MKNSVVSIIIPCFNAEKFLEDALLSCLCQKYWAKEIIVIDDGSTDDSLKILKKYERSIYWETGSNRGGNSARNRGIELASGDYFVFLDADDYLLPGAIEAQAVASEQLQPSQFSVGRSYQLSQQMGVLLPHARRDAATERGESISDMLVDVPVLSASLYPRRLIECIEGFKNGLTVRQDFDLFVRAVIAGFEPVFVDVPVFVYRNHASGNRVSKQSDMQRADAEAGLFDDLFMAAFDCADLKLKQEISLGLAKACWVTARNTLRSGYIEQARALFALAKRLDGEGGGITGRPAYKALCRLTGEIRAEKILQRLKGRGIV